MRKKLKKYLGKEVLFSATVGRVGEPVTNRILLNVKENGKLVTDHIWVNETIALKGIGEGNEVYFRATVESYKDSHGVRKYGVIGCRSYLTSACCEEDTLQKHGEKQKKIRRQSNKWNKR